MMRAVFVLALAAAVLAPACAASSRVSPIHLAQLDVPLPEGGRKPTEAERKAAIASIEAQLKAFKADDYVAAMKYQSSTLKEQIETADRFKAMMKQGYPQFARYKSITYGLASCDTKGDRLAIQVTLTGEDNVTVRGVYLMLREKGEYKVDTVIGGMKPRLAPRDEV